jgi:hypothetical protein
MATVNGPYTLAPKQSWFFWFYPNGNWRSYNEVIADPHVLSVTPRPRAEVPEWNVFESRTHVVLERNGNGFRHSYRVLIENPTNSIAQFDIVTSVI